MEEEFVVGLVNSALEQIHEVMAVYLPAVPKSCSDATYVCQNGEAALMK